MAKKKENELVSVRQAAQECGRNMETVRRWIWSGKLPAEKLGNQLFIKRDDFITYCRESAVAYDARPKPATARLKGTAKEDFGAVTMETAGRKWHETTAIEREREMKLAFLKKATAIRDRIRTRTGAPFDVETIDPRVERRARR